ncbi:hypothetical protein RND81_11G003400 [Saponaria officinalis]|uniref:DUF1664 domain-containing protein n=1 Tax=Saponaria officinalis TaxID=3572 RepID=A0AAW1HGC0_SAPOF
MSLPFGKLTILIGAGVLGSILAKEGRIPGVSDVLSGALKIALKPITQTDSAPATSKPRNDALIAQVNSLRQELQLLASSRPVTIVTSSRAGGRRFGVIIVIVVLGYGCVWWKGWKLPDFMFATKRTLKDACNTVANELEEVFKSVEHTKKDVSSTLDDSSCKFNDIVACTATTKVEVGDVCERITEFSGDIQSFSNKIRILESDFDKIQSKQDITKEGIGKLMLHTLDSNNRINDLIQAPPSATRPALEHSRVAVSSRTVSLPASMPLDLPSPSTSNGSSEMSGHMRRATSTSGVKVGNKNTASNTTNTPQDSEAAENTSSPSVSNGNRTPEISEELPSPAPSSSQPVRSAGFLSRTISATLNFKFM